MGSMPEAKANVAVMAAAAVKPCSACKLLRRRCGRDCFLAPYFPAEDLPRFACVHRVFGASKVTKMLQGLPPGLREDAVSSMVYEASSRLADPVNGCVAVVSALQAQVTHLQTQLALTQGDVHILVSALNSQPQYQQQQQLQPVLPSLQHMPCDNASTDTDPDLHGFLRPW